MVTSLKFNNCTYVFYQIIYIKLITAAWLLFIFSIYPEEGPNYPTGPYEVQKYAYIVWVEWVPLNLLNRRC